MKRLNGWVIMINPFDDEIPIYLSAFRYSTAFSVEELSALESPSSYSEKSVYNEVDGMG